MTRKLLTILALLLTLTQGAWAVNNYTPTKMSTAPTEGPWKFDAVNNGYYSNTGAWSKSFNNVDKSAWNAHSDGGNITYQWQDGDGTGFSMHCKSIKTSRYGVLSTYTHSESVPAYTRKVLTWNYTLKGGSHNYPQNVTLYAHTDLATLKATTVDFTHDYSNNAGSTYYLTNLTQGGGSGTKETSSLTKTFEFDNRNGSSAQTKTWALLLTHVVNNASSSANDCHQWGSFKNYSYSWATYYYKYVTFNSNGGMGTMSQQTVVNSANLTANAFTREGYTFAGWATSANGEVVYANGAGITATSDSKGPVTLYAQWTFQGSGTENDPYLIPSTDVWNFLATKVNAGNAYSGKYFQLTADIGNAVNPLTQMLGVASNQLQETDKPFMGTFDGAGHTLYVNLTATDGNGTGPFLYIKEATIKNLHIDGIVSGEGTNYNRIGGLYGRSGGGVTIDNCRISVNIKGGAWSVGGVGGESYTTIRNTVYDGKLECPKSGAGFIGWSSTDATIENCVFNPQEGSYITKKDDEGDRVMGPFYRYGNSDATLTNCYYLTSLGDAQGKHCRTITAGSYVTINGLGSATGTYNVSGITVYSHGIKYNDTYYAGNGDAVSLSLSHGSKTGYTFNQYTVTGGGTLANPTTNSPTLTMTDANQVINADWTRNAVTLTDGEGVSALSAYAGQECDVTYSRSFTSGKPSTVCLPFAYAPKTGETFYTFTGITKENGGYIATMTEYTDANLVANTPYLFMPTGNADFSGTYAIPADLTAGTTTSGDWTFVGTYTTVSWTEAPTGIYGFSAQNVDAQGISQGQFVKVGAYVRVKPMRCYLKYKNGGEDWAGTRAMTRAADNEELPETISVRLIAANGEVTAIGTISIDNGQWTIDNYYDLNGRKLNGKPTAKGIYVNNGKKYIIK